MAPERIDDPTHRSPYNLRSAAAARVDEEIDEAVEAWGAYRPTGVSDVVMKADELLVPEPLAVWHDTVEQGVSDLAKSLHRHARYMLPEAQAERKARRDAARAEKHAQARTATGEEVEAKSRVTELPRRGEFLGRRTEGPKPAFTDLVTAGPPPYTKSARVYDADGRLFAYRSWGSADSPSLGALIVEAVQRLEAATCRPEVEGAHARGDFSVYKFMFHRAYVTHPMKSVFLSKNETQAACFAKDIQKVTDLVEAIFRHWFPDLYRRYDQCLQYIQALPRYKDQPLPRFWGPFASMAVNIGGKVVTDLHTDADNLADGLCVIVAGGSYDYMTSAYLVLDLGDGDVVAFELPPGVPMFFPSALVGHFNTEICYPDEEKRVSLVYWSSGKLFQYQDLGGRAMSQLTKEDVQAWVAAAKARAGEAAKAFPLAHST